MEPPTEISDGLVVERLDEALLVLEPATGCVYRLEGIDAEAFEAVRAGTTPVPTHLRPAVAGLVELGLVRSSPWTRRTVLGLGGAAVASAVSVMVLPTAAAAQSSPAGPDGGTTTTTTPTSTSTSTTTTTTTTTPTEPVDPNDPTTAQCRATYSWTDGPVIPTTDPGGSLPVFTGLAVTARRTGPNGGVVATSYQPGTDVSTFQMVQFSFLGAFLLAGTITKDLSGFLRVEFLDGVCGTGRYRAVNASGASDWFYFEFS